MALACFSKPKSRRRSASSRMSHLIESLRKHLVVLRWSNSRPGVQTRIVTPFRRRAFSLFRRSPPDMLPGTSQMKGRTTRVRTLTGFIRARETKPHETHRRTHKRASATRQCFDRYPLNDAFSHGRPSFCFVGSLIFSYFRGSSSSRVRHCPRNTHPILRTR